MVHRGITIGVLATGLTVSAPSVAAPGNAICRNETETYLVFGAQMPDTSADEACPWGSSAGAAQPDGGAVEAHTTRVGW